VRPVGFGLDPSSFHRHERPIDAEQLLDPTLGLLVSTFAEVLVADDAFPVDEVERRPVVVVEGAPDPVVVVDHDRVVDRAVLRGPPYEVDLVLERELRCVHSDDHQPVLLVGLRPGAEVRRRAKPVDARQGPEVDEDDVASQIGPAQGGAVEPFGSPGQRRHVQTREHGQPAQRSAEDGFRIRTGHLEGLAPPVAVSSRDRWAVIGAGDVIRGVGRAGSVRFMRCLLEGCWHG
jgi:hypothetical protein